MSVNFKIKAFTALAAGVFLFGSMSALPALAQSGAEDPFAALRSMAQQEGGNAQGQQTAQPVQTPSAVSPSNNGNQSPPPPPVSGMSGNASLDAALGGAQMSAEERQRMVEEQARNIAFDAAINGLLPLRPDEIRKLLRQYDSSTEAAQRPLDPAPKPEITVETISLDPGVAPPVIKVSPGLVTTLTMLDLTGEPWPIKDVIWGGDFDVIQPEQGGHVLRISPLGEFKRGNMSIRMVDLNTPITFMLQAGMDVVQYRFDARIPEYGPNAAPSIIETSGAAIRAAAGNRTLMAILDGVPPSEAKTLELSGIDGRSRAYKLGGKIFLRTPLTLLSPAWSESVNSIDGMKVYVLNDTPVLLLSDQGQVVRAAVREESNSEF